MSIKIYMIVDPVDGKEKPVRFEACEQCKLEFPADNGFFWRLVQPGGQATQQVCAKCAAKKENAT